jgi:hypothetical protein
MSSEREASGLQASRAGSTVLARMIQRTRELRPSLEPVIQPLFAPRTDGFVSGPDPAPDAPSPYQPPPDSLLPDVLALEAFPPYVRWPDARQREALRSETTSAGVLLPEALDAALADLPESSATSTRGGRRHPPGGRGRASGTGAPAAPEFPSPADGSASATGAFAAGFDAEAALVSGDRPALLAPAPLAPALLAPGPPPRRENPAAQRGYRSAARVPADQEGAPGPAVTITIGHIEVRAAAPAARPPRPEAPPRPKPAFRPQTTLAGFLDGGAGGSGRR